MGLDTNFYYVQENEAVNPKTNEVLNYISAHEECAYFRKNYCLIEWFEKHWNRDVVNCIDYIVDKSDIDALIEDCNLAIDLVDDVVKGREIEWHDTLPEITTEVHGQLNNLFPMNSWRDCANFNGKDYNELKEIVHHLGDIEWENMDKLIFTNWW